VRGNVLGAPDERQGSKEESVDGGCVPYEGNQRKGRSNAPGKELEGGNRW